MLGAIVGDIVGSIYEFDNIKTKDFKLFGPHANNNPNYAMNGRDNSECFFTDDTVLTSAVANWAMGDTSDLSDILSDFTFRYSNRGYGGMYMQWANSWDRQPYNSFGNGSAMRVSSVPWLVPDYAAMLAKSKASAEVAHNHPEGIKGAQATALAIWLAREGDDVGNIRRAVSEFAEYDLTETVNEIREWYYFNETCQKTVPQAIINSLIFFKIIEIPNLYKDSYRKYMISNNSRNGSYFSGSRLLDNDYQTCKAMMPGLLNFIKSKGVPLIE